MCHLLQSDIEQEVPMIVDHMPEEPTHSRIVDTKARSDDTEISCPDLRSVGSWSIHCPSYGSSKNALIEMSDTIDEAGSRDVDEPIRCKSSQSLPISSPLPALTSTKTARQPSEDIMDDKPITSAPVDHASHLAALPDLGIPSGPNNPDNTPTTSTQLEAICILQQASVDMLKALMRGDASDDGKELSVAVRMMRTCLDDHFFVEEISKEDLSEDGQVVGSGGQLPPAVTDALPLGFSTYDSLAHHPSDDLLRSALEESDALKAQLAQAQMTDQEHHKALQAKDIELASSNEEIGRLRTLLIQAHSRIHAEPTPDDTQESLTQKIQTQQEALQKHIIEITSLEKQIVSLKGSQKGKKKKKGGQQPQKPKKGKKAKNGRKAAEAAMKQAKITRKKNANANHDPTPGVAEAYSRNPANTSKHVDTPERARIAQETRRLWELKVGRNRSGQDGGDGEGHEVGRRDGGPSRPGYDCPPHGG